MLVEQITDPWIKYLLSKENPKAAFLYVVSHFNSVLCNKMKMLADIVDCNPEVLGQISDEELRRAFYKLDEHLRTRKETVACIELRWVSKYVRGEDVRLVIEAVIYRRFLEASDYLYRRTMNFGWTLSDAAKRTLVKGVLQQEDLGSKRKMEIARELGLPITDYARDYFKTLLRGGHYEQAAGLAHCWTEADVIEIILINLNNGHTNDAECIALTFLPGRQDVIDEIRKIRRKLGY